MAIRLIDIGGWLCGLFGSSGGADHQYYYGRLTDSQKETYRMIVSGIERQSPGIRLPLRPINEIAMVWECALLDNPLFFYVSPSFRYVSDLNAKRCIVQLDYRYARDFVRQAKNTVRHYLHIFDAVKSDSDVDKEKYVHDYCLNNFRYDHSFGEHSDSVLGLVLNKSAVCEGIAKFVKLSLDCLGVRNLVVHGKARNPMDDSILERHAWNIVFIEGNAYHLDVTFDMEARGTARRYDYFNLADKDIKKDRTIISDAPACSTIWQRGRP